MRVIAIVGHQGSGKTTLIEKLIPALQRRGLRVSTIKHAHHHHIELDVPGKDSHRHRVAGASEVIVASDTGWARIAASTDPASLQVLLGELRPVDVVLVEGFKRSALPKIEIWRAATGHSTQYTTDAHVVAICTDSMAALPEATALPLLDLNDPAAVAAFLLNSDGRFDYVAP